MAVRDRQIVWRACPIVLYTALLSAGPQPIPCVPAPPCVNIITRDSCCMDQLTDEDLYICCSGYYGHLAVEWCCETRLDDQIWRRLEPTQTGWMPGTVFPIELVPCVVFTPECGSEIEDCRYEQDGVELNCESRRSPLHGTICNDDVPG